MHEAPPSPWLRLVALGASAATLLAVVSGAASLGAAHQLLSALALPPLVAVLVAAWLGHRRLVVPALLSIALFGLAALITVDGLHLAAAAVAFASTLVLTALTFRGGAAARLRCAAQAADHVAAAADGGGRDVRRRPGRAAPGRPGRARRRPRARL